MTSAVRCCICGTYFHDEDMKKTGFERVDGKLRVVCYECSEKRREKREEKRKAKEAPPPPKVPAKSKEGEQQSLFQ